MSRGFFGGPSGGGSGFGSKRKKNEFREKFDKMIKSHQRNYKSTMDELVREKTRQLTDYKEMIEDLMDEKMFNGGIGPSFHLPGTVAPEKKEMTKGQKMAMELAMQKRAKERAKIRDQRVEVVPKQYTGRAGGWIDKTGKIRNKFGVIVMEVNLDTGAITNRMGMKVGKYNPKSMSCDYKIQRLIDQYTRDAKKMNPFQMNT